MKRRARAGEPTGDPTPATPATATRTMSLDELERVLSAGVSRMPNDMVIMRETARALRAVSSGADFATLTCEHGERGVRITGGRDALAVARVLRARADWRGDHHWAGILGRRLRFRIVRTEEGDAAPTTAAPADRGGKRSRGARTATRLAARGARLALN